MSMHKFENVRVRFAPSPTGHLHIGGLRTVIFNYLFARNCSGKFLLRIEDTDRERSLSEYTDSIFQALEWMGINADESVIFQSNRLEQYQEAIKKLIAEDKAYRCYCSAAHLEKKQEAAGQDYRYDKSCRDLKEIKPGPFVVRFKLPQNLEHVKFNDIIRGEITVESDQLDDFIIIRSDGWPVYNFAVVVDDEFMRISHVIRGEEHISNTPKQILLYQAFGYKVPYFAHLPLILGSSGKKLSKREAAVSVFEYRLDGYLSDALFNFLVRLGWSHGDQEIFTRDELIKYFSLENVQKKGAIFDINKLNWLNGVYIRQASNEDLIHQMKQINIFNSEVDAPKVAREHLDKLITLYKERAKTLKDIVHGLMTVINTPLEYESDGMAKWVTHQTENIISLLLNDLRKIDQWNHDEAAKIFSQVSKQLDLKIALFAQPVRLALTGVSTSPGIYELLEIIGKAESIKRIEKFLDFIKKR